MTDDYFTAQVPTRLGQQDIYDLVSELMSDFSWRRGESQYEGALKVSGHVKDGASITFYLYDDEPEIVTATLSSRTVTTDQDGSSHRALIARLETEIFPRLATAKPTSPRDDIAAPTSDAGATGVAATTSTPQATQPPPKRRELPSPSREGEAIDGGVIVYDLWDWIPGAGEDALTLTITDTTVTLSIGSIPTHGDSAIEHIHLDFHGTVFHQQDNFYERTKPIDRGSVDLDAIGRLVEVTQSGLLNELLANPTTSANQELKHYHVTFQEIEEIFDFLAASVTLRGER